MTSKTQVRSRIKASVGENPDAQLFVFLDARHRTVRCRMAVDGQVAIRPTTYLAFSYDHRVVDGKDTMTARAKIKHCIADPSQLLLEV